MAEHDPDTAELLMMVPQNFLAVYTDEKASGTIGQYLCNLKTGEVHPLEDPGSGLQAKHFYLKKIHPHCSLNYYSVRDVLAGTIHS